MSSSQNPNDRPTGEGRDPDITMPDVDVGEDFYDRLEDLAFPQTGGGAGNNDGVNADPYKRPSRTNTVRCPLPRRMLTLF